MRSFVYTDVSETASSPASTRGVAASPKPSAAASSTPAASAPGRPPRPGQAPPGQPRRRDRGQVALREEVHRRRGPGGPRHRLETRTAAPCGGPVTRVKLVESPVADGAQHATQANFQTGGPAGAGGDRDSARRGGRRGPCGERGDGPLPRVRRRQKDECLSPATTRPRATSRAASTAWTIWETPDRTIAQCQVTLIARVASDGWRFDGWEGGGCEGRGRDARSSSRGRRATSTSNPRVNGALHPDDDREVQGRPRARDHALGPRRRNGRGSEPATVVELEHDRPQEGPTFACWLDGGAIPCANTLSGSPTATTPSRSRADPSGNQATAGRVWNQQVPLQLSLSTPSPGRTATFTFGPNKASGVAYQCRSCARTRTARGPRSQATGRAARRRPTATSRCVRTGSRSPARRLDDRRRNTFWTVVDSDAPSITAGAPDGGVVVSDGRQQRFQVTTDEPATFQCRLDNAAPATCDPVAGHTVANLRTGCTPSASSRPTRRATREIQFAWEQQAPARATLTDGPAEGKPARTSRRASSSRRRRPASRSATSAAWMKAVRGRLAARRASSQSSRMAPTSSRSRPCSRITRAPTTPARPWHARGRGHRPARDADQARARRERLSSETAVQFQLESEPDARFECSLDQQPFAPARTRPPSQASSRAPTAWRPGRSTVRGTPTRHPPQDLAREPTTRRRRLTGGHRLR